MLYVINGLCHCRITITVIRGAAMGQIHSSTSPVFHRTESVCSGGVKVMVSVAIPPVIIRVMHHCTYRAIKPFLTTLELHRRRTARCCLLCYLLSPIKSIVYNASNVWFVVTGVPF